MDILHTAIFGITAILPSPSVDHVVGALPIVSLFHLIETLSLFVS